MTKEYKVTIGTSDGKTYRMDWYPSESQASKCDHICELFFKHPYYVINEGKSNEVIIPRSAVTRVKFTEDRSEDMF